MKVKKKTKVCLQKYKYKLLWRMYHYGGCIYVILYSLLHSSTADTFRFYRNKVKFLFFIFYPM